MGDSQEEPHVPAVTVSLNAFVSFVSPHDTHGSLRGEGNTNVSRYLGKDEAEMSNKSCHDSSVQSEGTGMEIGNHRH